MSADSGVLPPWMIFHLPHDSTRIPAEVQEQFVLTPDCLAAELVRMTDHHTARLFAEGVPAAQCIRAAVSRLVVDVERYEDDALEPMSLRGMGAVYRFASNGEPLRRTLSASERESLLDRWYRPHHRRLQQAVDEAVAQHGRALVVDCHSFASVPLPHEPDQRPRRPDICIGTDAFHTRPAIAECAIDAFERRGMSVMLNRPFSGALVPAAHYRKDARCSALMIEVNRRLYLNESSGELSENFQAMAEQLREVLQLVARI